MESSDNEEKVGQCFVLDYDMFKNKLGSDMNQAETRRNWHTTAKIAESR